MGEDGRSETYPTRDVKSEGAVGEVQRVKSDQKVQSRTDSEGGPSGETGTGESLSTGRERETYGV